MRQITAFTIPQKSLNCPLNLRKFPKAPRLRNSFFKPFLRLLNIHT